MVTIIQPTGFSIGVVTTALVIATIERKRSLAFSSELRGLIPAPAREQLIVSTVSRARKVA